VTKKSLSLDEVDRLLGTGTLARSTIISVLVRPQDRQIVPALLESPSVSLAELDDLLRLHEQTPHRQAPSGESGLLVTQRWEGRRSRFRPSQETFDPSQYGVEVIPAEHDTVSKAFVTTHHYAKSAPPTVFRVGLYEKAGPRPSVLVGVALFTVPAHEATIPSYAPGLSPREGVELGRFVLRDHVKAMAETWFLARAFKALAAEKKETALVLSFSDPVPKVADDGTVIMPGHIGLIYQAHNARFVRRTRPEHFWQDAQGRDLAPRSLSKIRNEERGWEGAMHSLVARGAPIRRPHEDLTLWLHRALREGPFRRYRHPGKYAYVWGLGKRRKEIEGVLPEAKPYPRRGDSGVSGSMSASAAAGWSRE
jgi:hypothetical protein